MSEHRYEQKDRPDTVSNHDALRLFGGFVIAVALVITCALLI